MDTQQSIDNRIEIVNNIIKEIASHGRNFFKYEAKIGYIFRVNKKLYMRSEYNGFDIYLCAKTESKPYEFTHGGTLWGLTKDFKEFILTGNKSNGENGYGGLYSPHWGYPEEDMELIRIKAKELGYL
jgi:hypothetical protein